MAKNWSYVRDGRQFGPCTSAELKELVGAGSLTPQDLVQEAGMTDWIPAGSVVGLFPTEPLPAAPAPSSDVEASSEDPFAFARGYSEVATKARRHRVLFDDARRVALILAAIGMFNGIYFALGAVRAYNALQMLEKARGGQHVAILGPSPEMARRALMIGVAGVTVALGFVGLAAWARYNPLPPAVIGFTVYVALVLVDTVVMSVTARGGVFVAGFSLLVKLVFISLFLEALRAAFAWRRARSAGSQ